MIARLDVRVLLACGSLLLGTGILSPARAADPADHPIFDQLTLGADHSCGLTPDHQIICWGENVPTGAPYPGETYLHISAGNGVTCGVREDLSPRCWGRSIELFSEIVSGQPESSIQLTQISAGRGTLHCGLDPAGEVVCWGDVPFEMSLVPPGPYTQLSVGDCHACGLRGDGTLACWGCNQDRQASAPSGFYDHVSAGKRHTCAVGLDAQVRCWGFEDVGQCSPIPGPFSQVASGDDATCALGEDGKVYCWGRFTDVLGSQTRGPQTYVDSCAQLHAGDDHFCCQHGDGAYTCWGEESGGRLGVEQGLWGLGANLDMAGIEKKIQKSMSKITDCYAEELARDASAKGSLEVRFTVQPDGTVGQAAVAHTTFASAPVSACVLEVFGGMRFPKHSDPGVQVVSYPIVFQTQ